MNDNLNVVSLKTWGIRRPKRIQWYVEIPPGKTVEDIVRSKSLKKIFSKRDSILEQNHFTFQRTPLSREKFLDWLSFYEVKIEEHSYQKKANIEWYDNKIQHTQDRLEIIEIFRDNVRVSAGIIVHSVSRHEPILAFSASERFHFSNISNASLGSILNMIFFDEMIKQGYHTISGGRSRNAFGSANTFGYLSYKLRLGYNPRPDDQTTGFATEVPVNNQGEAGFFGIDEHGDLQLYFLLPHANDADHLQQLYTANFTPIILRH
jgi:hypothetical protein